MRPAGLAAARRHRRRGPPAEYDPPVTPLREVLLVFLRLGTTAFGGPAAHIAMTRDEVVRRRRWLSDDELLDLVAAVNLIPGPNSTELAIHLGLRQAGWRGFAVAGLAFIVPAFLIVTALAAAYVRYGTTPEARWLLHGVNPVVVAIVADALVGFGRQAMRSITRGAFVVASAALALAGIHELVILAGAGAVGLALAVSRRLASRGGIALLSMVVLPASLHAAAVAASAVPFTIDRLGLFFLKVGSILFGSGYVLLAFLRADLVARWGWLTEQQLLDAVAVGQVTPGPLFTTASFIGYVLGGLPGAVVATVAIFTPAFVFVAVTHHWIARLRASPIASALLDGFTLASLGLMAAVTARLSAAALVDWPSAAIAASALAVLWTRRVNPTWLIVAGAAAGWVGGR